MARTPDADEADEFDDLYWEPRSEQIVEDDAFLRKMVAGAELPVLLAAIAAVLRDTSYLAAELVPPLPPMDTAPHPHGGMTEDQQQKAATLALAGLKAIRDDAIRSVHMLPDSTVREIFAYLTGGRDEWRHMLTHELDIAEHKDGKPDWNFDDVAGGRQFSTLIVGAGVSGIAAAFRYSQAGVPFVLIEAGTSVGGTWAKNIYPGVRLDTPTFGYSYSFAQRSDWPNQFAQGGEILDYLRDIAERAGITERTEFSTRLVRLEWVESARQWLATTRGSDGVDRVRRFSAIVSAVGQLDRPNIPDIAGSERYRGVAMHTQEWDRGVDLTGKRVAVIGTGASAYQVVPAIVDTVDSLVVFQRSAPWMLPAPNYHHPVTDAFTWLRRKVPHYAQWYRLWVILTGIPGRAHTVTAEQNWSGSPLSISQKNQQLRDYLTARVHAQLADRPDLLEHAIPDYPPGAKRMLRDNEVWAAALRSAHTTLVTSGIDRFTENGIVDASGREHPVDIVVYATGFKPSDYLDEVEVIGRDGREIHEFWDGDARAYNGVTVPGFPNLFLIYGPNVGGVVAGSLHFMLERAAEYSLTAIREILERDISAIDVRPEALDRFVGWVDEGNRKMAWGQPYVKTWYQNRHGRVSQIWPYTNVEYWDITQSIDEDDYEFLP